MSTSTQTSCYVMVILGWGWVGQWRSCQLAHTRHATLLLCSLALAHTRHATLWLSWGEVGWGNDVHVNLHTHTRHATLWLCWGGVGWGGAMTFMSTCTHTSCYVIVMFSCTCTHTSCYVMVILGWGWVGWGGAMTFMSTCTHTSCTQIIFPKAFQDGCIMESTQKNTLNWKSLSWVTVGENLWDHWHLTDFSKNFARASKQWMKRFWEEGKKCCIPKKHELMSKNEVVLEIFKTLFFTSTWKNDVSL